MRKAHVLAKLLQKTVGFCNRQVITVLFYCAHTQLITSRLHVHIRIDKAQMNHLLILKRYVWILQRDSVSSI